MLVESYISLNVVLQTIDKRLISQSTSQKNRVSTLKQMSSSSVHTKRLTLVTTFKTKTGTPTYTYTNMVYLYIHTMMLVHYNTDTVRLISQLAFSSDVNLMCSWGTHQQTTKSPKRVLIMTTLCSYARKCQNVIVRLQQ